MTRAPGPTTPSARAPVPLRLRVDGVGGRAARGATVRVFREGALVWEGTADAQGSIAHDLPPGRYDVHVEAADGLFARVKGLVLDGSPGERSIDLAAAGSTALRLRFLRGTAPLPGLDVYLAAGRRGEEAAPRRIAGAVASVRTDPDGRAAFPAVPPGAWEVLVPLGEAAFLRWGLRQEGKAEREITLGDEVLLRGRATQGLDGPPVPDVALTIRGWREPAAVVAHPTTGADGAFALRLPAARYDTVLAERDGFLAWPPHDRGGAAQEERQRLLAGLLPLADGRDGEIEIPLRFLGGPALIGRLVDPAGAGVPDVGVRILPADPWLRDDERTQGERVTRSGADGRFEIEGLPAGTYDLWVPGGPWRTTGPNNPRVTIPPDARAPVEVRIPVVRAAFVTGRVVRPDGSTAPAARVWWTPMPRVQQDPDAAGLFESFADGEGRFALPSVESNLPFALCAAWGDLQSEPLPLPAGRDVAQDVVLRLGPAARLVVRFVEAGSRRPVPWALATLVPVGAPHGRAVATWRADAEGRLEIPSILRARWRIAPASGWHRPAEALELDLTEAKEPRTVEIVLDPGLAIGGRVQDVEGHAVPARVHIVGQADDGEPLDRVTATDADGRFRATGFAWGRYTLTVTPTHHAPLQRTDLRGGEGDLELVVGPPR